MNAYTALTVFLIYVSIIAHELGHFKAARDRGFEASEIGIGLAKGPSVSFTPKTGPYAGIKLSFYFLTCWMGAFVRLPDTVFNLPYKEKACVAIYGPLANIRMGCALLLLATLCAAIKSAANIWNFEDLQFVAAFYLVKPYVWIPAVAIPLSYMFRRTISAYLAPLIGAGLMWYVLSDIFESGIAAYVGDLQGPVGFFASLPEMSFDVFSSLWTGALFSFLIGGFNMLPLFPLDGGLLILPFVEKISDTLATVYRWFGMIVLYTLFAFIVGKDMIAIFPKEIVFVIFVGFFIGISRSHFKRLAAQLARRK